MTKARHVSVGPFSFSGEDVVRFHEQGFALLCEQITKGIVKDINERRTSRWAVPWANGGHCVNAMTNRPYTGELNILILSCTETNAGYVTAQWLTERQAQSLGGWIREGEKPTTILFGRSGKAGTRRGYGNLIQVFNLDQVEGLPPLPRLPDSAFHWSFPRVERLIANCRADFRIGGRRAFYHSREDYIQVPPPSRFFKPDAFVWTCVHELAHWTKHPTRLNRPPLDAVKHVADAREELAVELTTAFLLQALGHHSWPIAPSYIKEWLRFAKAEADYLFEIAPAAIEIAEYILAFDR